MWHEVSPVPVQMRQEASPVPVQMWQDVSPVPARMWHALSPADLQPLPVVLVCDVPPADCKAPQTLLRHQADLIVQCAFLVVLGACVKAFADLANNNNDDNDSPDNPTPTLVTDHQIGM